MRYLPTSKLMPGMALGQDIYDGAGRLLLTKHLLLNAEYISNLEFKGFPGIYIDDEFTRGIELQEVICPQVKSQALKVIYELFTFHTDEEEISGSEVKIQKIVEAVVENIISNGDVMYNMMDIKNYDDYIYFHSINVGVLSIMTGARYGLTKDELCQLGIAAMLHDIGKRFIEQNIAIGNQPLIGQEREVYMSHAKLGAEFLRGTYHFSASVYEGILEHHEWYNGQGYPLGKSQEDISLFARIIKITDCYDVLTTKTPMREGQAPADTIEYLMAMAGVQFDPDLVNVFMRKIAVYPVGCEVCLSNGQMAVVVKNFENFPIRPLVKIIETGKLVNLRDDAEARALTIGQIVLR